MAYQNSIVHQLINKERRKRGLPYVRWSQEMYYLAKNQANSCARIGHCVHSGFYALQGGECLCGGKGNLSAKAIVNGWMHSSEHRKWLLDPRVKSAGVGIAKSRHGTYAAWSFTDQPLHPQPQESVLSVLRKCYNMFKALLNPRPR